MSVSSLIKRQIHVVVFLIIVMVILTAYFLLYRSPHHGKRIALAFSAERKSASEKNPGDVRFIAYMRKKGLVVTKEIWDDKTVDWSQYDAVILYQTWSSSPLSSYITRLPEYVSWIKSLEQNEIPVYNNSSIIEDFSDKNLYISKLHEKNNNIIPTEFVLKNANISLYDIVERNNWNDIIVKTGSSEFANNIYRVIVDRAAYQQNKNIYEQVKDLDNNRSIILFIDDFLPIFSELLKTNNVLVQKYMPEIKNYGETSCVFIQDNMTHCVNKFTHAEGEEFRTQRVFSRIVPRFVELNEKQRADFNASYQAAFAVYGSNAPLVARIDMILDKQTGKSWLMEIEAIDPWMYLNELLAKGDKDAKYVFEKYYQALASRL